MVLFQNLRKAFVIGFKNNNMEIIVGSIDWNTVEVKKLEISSGNGNQTKILGNTIITFVILYRVYIIYLSNLDVIYLEIQDVNGSYNITGNKNCIDAHSHNICLRIMINN